MSDITVATGQTTPSKFPRFAIEAALRGELIDAIKIEASIRGIGLPAAPTQMAQAPVQIDSLVVVNILCTIEPMVGFELTDSVVRAGGYNSVADALWYLLPKIENEWNKKQGSKP